jgi:uncharacterized repeat protein (TIGR04138 family)
MRHDLMEALREIVKDDPRYDLDAYLFLREALDVAVRLFNKPADGAARHVSGRELLDAIRRHALDEYGPMALRVLNTWGVRRTDDFGAIVFNMVERGVLGKTDEDKIDDFRGCYDFADAFEKPYLPQADRTRPARRRGPKRRTSDPASGPD